MIIRNLTCGDGPGVRALVEAAGWNQTDADILRLLRLEPEGCFGIDVDGQLAATATAVCYGTSVAWIGMVLTHPRHRGRGLGRALTEHAVEHVARRGVAVARLDATDMGRPLYERAGFIAEHPVERWLRPPAGVCACPEVAPFRYPASLDTRAFGADRSELVHDLARVEAASLPGGAYACARPGRLAAYFGPCVAESRADAEALLGWFLANHGHELAMWDLLPEHVDVARAAGFSRVRTLMRMRLPLGGSSCGENSLVYGLAGFEWG